MTALNDLIVDFEVAGTTDYSDALAIAAALEEAYASVFAGFEPLRGRRLQVKPPRVPGETPSGPQATFSVLYPDRSPAVVAFVEPLAPPRGRPRMRLKHRDSDPRLLGDRGARASLIPHELAHALHFAFMPLRWRMWIEARYAAWIAGQVARGGDARHDVLLRTSPLVAWLEAFGVFAERFWMFRQRHPDLSGEELHSAFLAHEYRAVQQWTLPSSPQDNSARPDVDVEGVVYRLVFVEYARRTSLATAVNLYLRSGTRGVRSYAGFAAALSSAPVTPLPFSPPPA